MLTQRLWAERQFVLERDRECVLHKRDPEHVCRKLGTRHRPDNLRLLTVEHVKERGRMAMGKRAPTDRRHMVAMCWDANVAVPSRELREWLRDYLEEVNREPEPSGQPGVVDPDGAAAVRDGDVDAGMEKVK